MKKLTTKKIKTGLKPTNF